jgi:hypothetical protein
LPDHAAIADGRESIYTTDKHKIVVELAMPGRAPNFQTGGAA